MTVLPIHKSANQGRELTVSAGGLSDAKDRGCDALTSYAKPARSWMIVIAKGANNGVGICPRPNARVTFESGQRRPRIHSVPDAHFLTVAGSYSQLSFVFPSLPKTLNPSRAFLSRPYAARSVAVRRRS